MRFSAVKGATFGTSLSSRELLLFDLTLVLVLFAVPSSASAAAGAATDLVSDAESVGTYSVVLLFCSLVVLHASYYM